MHARRFAIAFALTVGLSTAGPAIAQSDGELALARQWFKEADQAEKKQEHAAAVELFEKALGVKQTPQLFLRLGHNQEKLGHFVEALVAYERALELSSSTQLEPVAKIAREQIEALRPRLPVVTIAPALACDGLQVELDGKALAAAVLGSPIPVNPGEHALEARCTGRQTFALRFSIAERESREVAFELVAAPAAAAPPVPGEASPEPDTAEPDGPSRLPAALLIGGGAAALGAGIAFFALARGKDSSIDDLCGGPDRLACPASQQDEIRSDVSTVDTFTALSFIAGGVGIAAAGVGVAMLLSSPSPAEAARARSRTARPSFQVAPLFGPMGVGLGASGRF